MGLCFEAIDYFITSYEYINHATREAKIKKILEYLYIKHYSVLSSRAAVLSFFELLVKLFDSNAAKFLNIELQNQPIVLSRFLDKDVAYLPQNDKSIV
jgi:hypothetical protein